MLGWLAALVLFVQLPIPLYWFVMHPQIAFWRQHRSAGYIVATALGVAPGDPVSRVLSQRTFSAGPAANVAGGCGPRFASLRDLDFLAREARSGRPKTHWPNGIVRGRGTGAPRNLCPPSAPPLRGIAYFDSGRMFSGGSEADVANRSPVVRADIDPNFAGRTRITRAFWPRLRGLLPTSTAVCALGSEAARVTGGPKIRHARAEWLPHR
jgi:hypothetical protein